MRIPYGKPEISQVDIDAVTTVLHTDWLTTGPYVSRFEEAFATFVKADYAVAVNSGTAALHAALNCLNLSPGDEVIVPTMTFAASANAVRYVGATPIFVDVSESTLLIDTNDVKRKLSSRTRAIIAVDYAGQPCDYDALRDICNQHKLVLISDGCHAPGANYKNTPVGRLADMTTFSFHPVKHLTTAEGGMVTTQNELWAKRMKSFRNHGMDSDHRTRAQNGSFSYDMVELGYNYRLSDVQCALGLSQLNRLPEWLQKRRERADYYHRRFSQISEVETLECLPDRQHAYHLYVIKTPHRNLLFDALREVGVGANVHYKPVHLHTYYQRLYQSDCPVAERVANQILTLPLYPSLSEPEQQLIVDVIRKNL